MKALILAFLRNVSKSPTATGNSSRSSPTAPVGWVGRGRAFLVDACCPRRFLLLLRQQRLPLLKMFFKGALISAPSSITPPASSLIKGQRQTPSGLMCVPVRGVFADVGRPSSGLVVGEGNLPTTSQRSSPPGSGPPR